MKQDSSEQEGEDRPLDPEATLADYLDTLPAELRASYSEAQLDAVKRLLAAAIPKPTPKLVDLRFLVNFLAYRYYVVFFVVKDRRQRVRSEPVQPMVSKGNLVTALLVLIGINLLISLFIVLVIFLIKSVVGYSLLPHTYLAE